MRNIHYFAEGIENGFLDNWKSMCPNYGIILWNKANIPVEKYPFLNLLIEHKKWSVISDFVRHWAVYEFGGIYMDIDVELIKPLDGLLEIESFTCIEGRPVFANSAVSGGHKGALLQKMCLDKFCQIDFEGLLSGRVKVDWAIEVYVSPCLVSEVVASVKGKPLDDSDLFHMKHYEGFVTLPKEYFYPYNWNEVFTDNCITENTIGIHRWHKSW
jgi:hypothetical protein